MIIIVILFCIVLSLSVSLVSTHYPHSAHPLGTAWFFMCACPANQERKLIYVRTQPMPLQPHRMEMVHSCDTRLSCTTNEILDLWTTDRSRMPILSVTGKNAAALYHIAERMHGERVLPAEKFFYFITDAMPDTHKNSYSKFWPHGWFGAGPVPSSRVARQANEGGRCRRFSLQ